MSEATCAVLAAIFPLYMVTVVIERRATNMGIRRRKFYRGISVYSVGLSLAGVVYAVVGLGLGGLAIAVSVVLWIVFFLATAGVATVIIASLASVEFEEDQTQASTRRFPPSWGTRGRRAA